MDSSITDWLQVLLSAASFIATIAGLFFVAATLKEQVRINQQQFELLLIERTRASREFKPRLTLSYEKHQSGTISDNLANRSDYFYKIACKKNSAFAVKVTMLSERMGTAYCEVYGTPYYTLEAEHEDIFGVTFFNGCVHCFIRISYQDIDGRPYADDYELNLRHIYPAQSPQP